jgi:hypothetical protein
MSAILQMDKVSIVGDAIDYLRELQKEVKDIEIENSELEKRVTRSCVSKSGTAAEADHFSRRNSEAAAGDAGDFAIDDSKINIDEVTRTRLICLPSTIAQSPSPIKSLAETLSGSEPFYSLKTPITVSGIVAIKLIREMGDQDRQQFE